MTVEEQFEKLEEEIIEKGDAIKCSLREAAEGYRRLAFAMRDRADCLSDEADTAEELEAP